MQDLQRYAAPVYLGGHYLQDGFSDSTLSATMTFVRRHGAVWGITCRHVAEDLKYQLQGKPEQGVWRLWAGRISYNLCHAGKLGCRSNILTHPSPEIDFAVCKIDYCWSHLSEVCGKEAINLDYPSASKVPINSAVALGFSNDLKKTLPKAEGLRITNNLVTMCAPLRDAQLSSERKELLLYTEIQSEMAPKIGLSGCSGGPVFGLPDIQNVFDDWIPRLLGIVIEGTPSSPGGAVGTIFDGQALVKVLRLDVELIDQYIEECLQPKR